jgi:hypothetical protein
MPKESNDNDHDSKILNGQVKTLLDIHSEHCDNEVRHFAVEFEMLSDIFMFIS